MTAAGKIELTTTELANAISVGIAKALRENSQDHPGYPERMMAERRSAIASRARFPVWVLRRVESIETGTVFDLLMSPSNDFPVGRCVRFENVTISPERERKIYEMAIASEAPDVRKLAIHRRFGTSDADGAEMERLERESTMAEERLKGVDREVSRLFKEARYLQLTKPDLLNFIGHTLEEFRHLVRSVPKAEILDRGLHWEGFIPGDDV
jgi:hypothetical protein